MLEVRWMFLILEMLYREISLWDGGWRVMEWVLLSEDELPADVLRSDKYDCGKVGLIDIPTASVKCF
jgi:hypothetical protein